MVGFSSTERMRFYAHSHACWGWGGAHSFVIKKEILGFLMAWYSFWNSERQHVQQAKFGNSCSPVCLGEVLLLLCFFGEVALAVLREVPHYCTSRPSHGGARSCAGFQPTDSVCVCLLTWLARCCAERV